MGEADVRCMVQCCPALQTLVGEGVLTMQGALRRLRHLTRLTAMQARGPASASSTAAAAAVTALTCLQQIELRPVVGESGQGRKWRNYDFHGLICLTQLTAVTISLRGEPALLDPAPAAALVSLTNLARLDLWGAKLSEQQLRSVSGLSMLTSLSFAKGSGDSIVLGDLALDRLQRIAEGEITGSFGLSNVIIKSTVSIANGGTRGCC